MLRDWAEADAALYNDTSGLTTGLTTGTLQSMDPHLALQSIDPDAAGILRRVSICTFVPVKQLKRVVNPV